MASRYTSRINVPVDDELRGVYQAAADALDMELTTWVREWLQEGVPTMRAIVEARKAGGVGPLQAFMRSALAQGQQQVAGFDSEREPVEESA